MFGNILRSGITKVSTRLELFPFSEVIGWVLFKADVKGMTMNNVEDKGFASLTPTFIAKYYNLPTSEVSMTTDWINSLTIDHVGNAKMMTTENKSFRQRASGEYETTSLYTPYRLVALMLNRIFNRANGKFYKMGWAHLGCFVLFTCGEFYVIFCIYSIFLVSTLEDKIL